MDYLNGFCLDVEANGFAREGTIMWTICLTDLKNKNKKLTINPFKDSEAKVKLLEWIDEYDVPNIIFHNGLGYDIFALLFLIGIEHTVGPDTFEGRKVNFVDTFYLSMFLNPDRGHHSIEYFGSILGLPKMDFRQASIDAGIIPIDAPDGAEFQQHSDLMDKYCDRDTDVNVLVYLYLIEEWNKIYGKWDEWISSYKAGQKSFYLMSCQELTGWKFDLEYGKKLLLQIEDMMEKIRAEVEPKLPPRSLKKTEEKEYTMPAKPWKKDGSYSASWLKFVEKHKGEEIGDQLWKFYGKEYPVLAQSILDISLPMEMANQEQMKDWFLESGWRPSLWNYKRGPDGKPIRDPVTRQLIPTSPKIQEQGKLCPNLEKMEGEIVKQVVKWLSLRNRQSVLKGWLSNPRLLDDGRIGAGRTGIAATHRQKHNVVVNVPKADPKVLLGYEFRNLWISEEGFLIAAGDAAALEGRVQGHYVWKYDNGVTADELLKGDVHSKNAFAFYGDIYEEVAKIYISPDFDKENPAWKPYRNRSKNGFYALLYGCSADKLASTLGIDKKYGPAAVEKFWEANPGTAALKKALEAYWNSKGQKKYLPAIDGRILLTRKKSALLNTIFQSCGGIVMDYASCFMDSWLGKMYWDEKRRPYYLYKGKIVRRIGYMHDELEYECEEPIAKEIAKMIENAIKKAGEFLKIKVPLEGEGKVGRSWKDVH